MRRGLLSAVVASARVPSLAFAATGTSRRTASVRATGDNGSAAAEEEQDRILEEEEFAALHDDDGDDYLPTTHRLAKKADALDAELRRLRWELLERSQLLMDTTAATLSGRPTRPDIVVQRVMAAKKVAVARERRAAVPPAASGSGADEANPSHAHNERDSGTHMAAAHRRHGALTSTDFQPFMGWKGVPSVPVQILRDVFSPSARAAGKGDSAATGNELATLTADLDYLRRGKALHALNYYNRMILTPKRHIGHGLYQVLWNAWLGVQNGCGAFVFNILRGVKEDGWARGSLVGTAKGLGKAGQFLLYGWVVSPCLHIPRGLSNTLYGPANFLTGRYFFDAVSGRYMRCTVRDAQLLRHRLQREKRLLRTIGLAEFRRKRMAAESKWSQRLASMGFSVEHFQRSMEGAAASSKEKGAKQHRRRGGRAGDEAVPDPYQILGVRRTATQQQIKQQYKKLAMVFHPDIVGSHAGGQQTEEEKAQAHHKFEQISAAYQVLSNPEKRKAYDLGGAQGLSLHEGKFGHFMSRTPAQMVQSIFGGEGFRRLLIGDLLRSHWSLRFEAQVSISLHEFEELQCIRVRQLAVELAAMADVHAKRPSTGSYYKHAAAAAAAGGSRPRMVHSSSLPDPFGNGGSGAAASKFAAWHQRNMPGGGGGAAAAAGSKSPVIGKDLKDNIMEELGERQAPLKPGTTKAGGGRAGRKAEAALAAGAAAAGPVAGSPYVLVPGSNEYNCFSKDFEERCDRFVARLSDACFGPELLSEVGEVYCVGAQRFLGIRPFYAPKQLMSRKIASGIDRVWNAFLEKSKRMEKEEMAKRVISEYFNMEYDNVVADVHVVLRFAVQLVLQDCTESEEVRRKRCYAVWYLGERMMAKGTKWNHGKRDDADMMAYIQQAANSSASTSKPPAF